MLTIPRVITYQRIFDVSNIKYLLLELRKLFEKKSFLQVLFFRFFVFVQSSGLTI